MAKLTKARLSKFDQLTPGGSLGKSCRSIIKTVSQKKYTHFIVLSFGSAEYC